MTTIRRCDDCSTETAGNKLPRDWCTYLVDHSGDLRHRCPACTTKLGTRSSSMPPPRQHPWRAPISERAAQSLAEEDRQQKLIGGEGE